MNLLEICKNWTKQDPLNQGRDILTVAAIILGILSLVGVHMHLSDLAILMLILSILMISYANIQQSRKLAKATNELIDEKNRSDQAIQKLYKQKDDEISQLEIKIATCKDRTANCQESATKEHDRLDAIIQQERNRADKLQKAFDSIDMAYKKATGVSENTLSYGMAMSVVIDGSPEHLQRMSSDGLYQRAKRLEMESENTDIN